MKSKYSKNVGVAFNNLMLGTSKRTPREKRLIKKYPYKDEDFDGIINIADCSPYNPKKDVWYNPLSWGKSAPVIVTETYTTAPTLNVKTGVVTPGITTTTAPTEYPQTTKVIPARGGGGGGSYNPVTQTYTSPEGYQQSMAQAPTGETSIVTPQAITTPAVPSDKLGLGVSVVSAYKPLTSAELAAQKKLETEMKLRGVGSWITKTAEKLSLLKVLPYVTAPRDVLIDVFTGGKKKEENIPTYEELMKKQAKEKVSYYQRPTFIGGNILSAGTLYTTGLTAGEQLTTGLVQEEVTANAQAEQTARNIVNTWTPAAQGELNFDVGKIQEAYDAGKITYEEATAKTEKVQDRINQKYSNIITKELNPELKKIEDLSTAKRKEIVGKYTAAVTLTTGQKFVSGGLSVPSWSIPVAGSIFKAADITQMVISAPDLASSLYEKPLQTIGEIAPYILGGIAAAGIISGIKNSVVNSRLKAEALAKQRNLKTSVSNSVSVGNAVKAGVNADGSINWNVKVTTATKIINKNTGKLLDKVSSVSYVKAVTSPTGKGAVKAVVDAVSLELQRGGIRTYVSGNKVTAKLGLGVIKGEVLMQPTLAGDIFAGYGKFDTRTGVLKTRVTGKTLSFTEGEVSGSASLKIRMSNLWKQSALSNILSKKIAGYKEVKIIKAGKPSIKIKGTEEVFQSGIITDIYKNLLDVKGYETLRATGGFPTTITKIKVKPYVRKPAVEPKALRDYTKAWLKSFTPGEAQFDITGMGVVSGGVKLTAKQIKQQTVAQISAQAAATARANAVASSLVGGIKAKAGQYVPLKYDVSQLTKGVAGVSVMKQEPSVYYGTAYGIPVSVKDIQLGYQKQIRKGAFSFEETTTMPKARVFVASMMGISNLPKQEVYQPSTEKAESYSAVNIISRLNSVLGTGQVSRQQQKQQQKQLQAQKIQQRTKQITLQVAPFVPTFPTFPSIYYRKEKKVQYPKQLSYEKQMAKQRREYQASVAAVQLGIYAPRGKLPKRLTGFEIRPIEESAYAKQLNKIFA